MLSCILRRKLKEEEGEGEGEGREEDKGPPLAWHTLWEVCRFCVCWKVVVVVIVVRTRRKRESFDQQRSEAK